jgi:TonB family protein
MKFFQTPVIFRLLILFIGLNGSTVFSQKVFLNKNYKECDSSKASYYRLIEYNPNNKDAGTVRIYNLNGVIKTEKEYSSLSKYVLQGKFINYNDSGKVSSIYTYDSDMLNGPFVMYHDNGQLKAKGTYRSQELNDSLVSFYDTGASRRRDIYRDGELLAGKCFAITGADTTHFPFEKDAEFPGGMSGMARWIQTNIVYPQEAIEMGEQGRVFVTFVVEKNGDVSSIDIEKGVSPPIDEEVIRLISSMPQWTPGEVDGYVVRTKMRLPVNFKLDGLDGGFELDTALIEANYNWKIGSVLIDPYNDKVIVQETEKPNKKFVVYYRDPVTYKTKKQRLTRVELQNLRAVKFSSKKSCTRWHWFYKYP